MFLSASGVKRPIAKQARNSDPIHNLSGYHRDRQQPDRCVGARPTRTLPGCNRSAAWLARSSPGCRIALVSQPCLAALRPTRLYQRRSADGRECRPSLAARAIAHNRSPGRPPAQHCQRRKTARSRHHRYGWADTTIPRSGSAPSPRPFAQFRAPSDRRHPADLAASESGHLDGRSSGPPG